MKREHGHLNRERNKHRPENQALLIRRERTTSFIQGLNVEGVCSWRMEVEVYQSYQHEQTSGECVHKKLESDSSAIFTAPDQTDKVDRDQRYFPEKIEQQS